MNTRQPILIVQENPDEVALTIRALKRNKVSGEMIVIGDGEEAMDYLFGRGAYAWRDTSIMPQMVLLDLKLPRIDGKEVVQRLREDERTRSLPVVLLTSSEQFREVEKGFQVKSINKPVDFKEFSEEIGEVVEHWLLQDKSPKERRERGNGQTASCINS